MKEIQNKVKINVDWSFAWDLLSINDVKISKSNGPIRDKNIKNFEDLAAQLKEQLGEFRFNEILVSEEYKNLYQINKELYECVDLVKLEPKDSIAYRTDQLVYKRFLKKIMLQNQFFNTELSEVKMGYA